MVRHGFLHAPILPETRHMIGARELGLLRDHAVPSTPPDPEPFPPDSPFYDLPNLVLASHMAGAMGNELHGLAAAAITEVERFAAGLPQQDLVLEQTLDRIA